MSKWLLLIHQLPPKPIYLRAKIANRLAGVGAVALKNSVYALPERDDCLEDFEWIAQEALAGGGAAFVFRADFVETGQDGDLVDRFRARTREAYEALKTEIAEELERARKRGPTSEAPALYRLKKKLREIRDVDFFDNSESKEVDTMLRSLEDRVRGSDGTRKKTQRRPTDLVGRTWVTRQKPKIDRLASAWLIRRFVDPGARFRFLRPGDAPQEGEIGFDLVGGEFTHEGDRCTFETLLDRVELGAPGLVALAEIVHDIDLKDGKYGRPEALGVQQLVLGLCERHPRDEDRLAHGLDLFDDLYASFRTGGSEPPRGRTRSRRKK